MLNFKPNNKAQAFIVILVGLYLGYIGIDMLTKGVPADAAAYWGVLNTVFAVVFIVVALFTTIVAIRTFSYMIRQEKEAEEAAREQQTVQEAPEQLQEDATTAADVPGADVEDEQEEEEWSEEDVAAHAREDAAELAARRAQADHDPEQGAASEDER